MFSQTAEYALRAVVWLANNDDAPMTTNQIAKATQVSPDYLSKVLWALGRSGLVHAQRGKKAKDAQLQRRLRQTAQAGQQRVDEHAQAHRAHASDSIA